MNTAQPLDIGALDKGRGNKRKAKARRVTRAKAKGKGEQGAGMKTQTEDETPPGCEAHDEEENISCLDPLRNDGKEADCSSIVAQRSRHAHRSSAQAQPHVTTLRCDTFPSGKWRNDRETSGETNQASTTRENHRRQFSGCRRPQFAVKDLTAMRCEVEVSENGAHIQTGGRRWKLEQA